MIWSREGRKVGRVVREAGRKWGGEDLGRKDDSLYIHMLTPEWIFPPELFRLAKISPAEWINLD